MGTAGAAQAEKDMEPLFAGGAPSKLAPGELSAAHAARAWLLLGKGLSTEAREAFAQAVKLDPRNVDALNGEGRLLLNEGRYTEALGRFDQALQYDATAPETIANDAEAKLDVERPADAKQQLVEAKARFPKSVPILLLLGRVEQHLADNEGAEADFKAACEAVDPTRSDAVLPYVALAELYAARGKLPDAVAALHDAKVKLPPSAALERAFGEVAETQGNFDDALAHYRHALAMDANDAASHFRLAGLLRRMKKYDEAGAELDKVAAIDKDYPGLSLERGLLYEQTGDVTKAIEQFKAALAKAPDDPDLQLRVGEAYVAIGRPDDAVPMLKKVTEKRASSAEAQHYLGRALLQKGDTTSRVDAMRYLKHAVELDPNRAEFHVYLARAANEMLPPDLELASNEVDKALAIDKLDGDAFWQRGIVERVEGQIEDAINDEKHALQLRPSRYEAYAVLAECYQLKNDDKTALVEWPKAIAGDTKAAGPEGTVAHPEWLYRYGKLLGDHNENGAALAQLVPASAAGEKLDTHPGWLPDLEFLTAEALRKAGRKNDAVEHYKRFLEIAPQNSPYRADAKTALGRLGH
jgi:tetratricopeptide (TPR) repeat protein